MPPTRKPRYDGQLYHHLINEAVQSLITPPDLEVAPEVYHNDPVKWAVERLGVPEHTIRWAMNPGYTEHKWDGTVDPLVTMLEGLRDWKNVGVEAGTGTQKTFTAAIIVLWFLDCFENSTVVTVAPKEKQLTLNIWKEIGRLWPMFQRLRPQAELTTLRIRVRPGSDRWAAHGFACGVGADEESATKAQGFHAEHMLIVFEETPGIHHAIMTAFENTCTAPHNLRLALGNPDSVHDALHKFCESPNVVHVRVSALDHPNVVCSDHTIVPGAVSKQKVEERRLKYGPDSRLYRSRVRGIAPDEAADSLIRWSWCKQAARLPAERIEELRRKGPKALGVDVANSANGDKACIAHGQGAVLIEANSFPCPDANELGRKVAMLMDQLNIEYKNVGVDSVGVGAGTVNELKRLGKKCASLNGGEKPRPMSRREEEFNNLRSQMHWQFRIDLQHGEVSLPDDEEAFEDLTAVKWETKNGVIVVEPKEKIKERLGRSPDKGDAIVYWNWVRYSRGAATQGGAQLAI